ncbi:cation:proton antiporter [Oscillatoria acuminata]|uniref:Kef-type K+ transport system, membrane component n=1 Tax=Oscillatoria acuminata PCC 6304 TaxID=56110 RepID=K9TE37_9CYAN|nr:cation:proton antiporter [Oscillatoria acuminata]AFY80401.1 Kef-type K+ transport system, membrane component [Oscillatoria acuminata PCC 6304]
MEEITNLIPEGPIVEFTLLLLVILIVPPIFENLRLPGLIGLLVAGVVLGPDGAGLLNPNTDTMKLLSGIGKIYLMFVAGLEIDIQQFRKTKNRSIGFGTATFLVPLIVGTIIGRSFGFEWNPSILIGSLLASHTLLGYPIVNRLGVVGNEAVTVTIGATIFTDIGALLVLAICVSFNAGEFTAFSLILQLVLLGLYAAGVLFGVDRAGKEYFRRTGDEEGNQFLFVLLALFLAAVGAQLINVDQIVGAFLAGLAVNDVVGNGPVKEKVEFVGSVLFIPFFFVGMGLLLDINGFVETLTTSLGLTLAIVFGLLGSKFLAALVAKLLYRYQWIETLTMWSLSVPQVAATLAAALVGVQQGVITPEVFNTVIVLMLVTSILGPLMTARFASKLPVPKVQIGSDNMSIWWETQEVETRVNPPLATLNDLFTVVVPISNPLTQRYLIQMAALLARHESGQIVPLSVAIAHVHMDEPELDIALKESRRSLDRSVQMLEEFEVKAKPELRIDDDVSRAISRTAREWESNLIVMGWSPTTGLRSRLFGNLINDVFWASHCPVAVMRLIDEPVNIHRLLVPVKNLSPQTLRTVRFAQLFADANSGEITLLHVCARRTPVEQIHRFETDLARLVKRDNSSIKISITSIPDDDVVKVIMKAAQSVDMVILRSIRRRTAGGLTVSNVTTQVIEELKCSLILFGEPHS